MPRKPVIKPVHWQPPPAPIPWFKGGILVAVVMVIFGLQYVWIQNSHRLNQRVLPVLAEVPKFSFTSETGATVDNASLRGKIWVANFIFTRCAGPCPAMTEKMRQLQIALRNSAGGKVQLVTVTVDPAYDTPQVLSKYGARIGSNPDRWSFLTGDPGKVADFVSKGLLLGLSKDGEGMPVHTQKFVLVDREGFIRAYHDFPGDMLIPDIATDVEALGRESHTPKEKKES